MRTVVGDSGNYYGSTTTHTEQAATTDPSIPRQTFSISEPAYHESRETHYNGNSRSTVSGLTSCCRTSGKNGESIDGLRVIVISMFVFSIGVTVALVIQIAAESSVEIPEMQKVVSGHQSCSSLGEEVLAAGGNAIDAAITSTFCMALVEPHMVGLGGGGFMLIRKHRSNQSVVIDFRETAPASAKIDKFQANPLSAQVGQSSIGVPGFLAGLAYAHKKYGSGYIGSSCCQWSELLWKSIRMAFQGVRVSQHFINATQTKLDPAILNSTEAKNLRDFIAPNGIPLTEKSVYGDAPLYAKLLEVFQLIAKNGSEAFYGGSLGQQIIQDLGGAISMEDLKSYQVLEREPIFTNVGGFEIMSMPAPSSGPELLAFMNTLERYNETHGMEGLNTSYLAMTGKVLRRLHREQTGLGDAGLDSTVVENRTHFLLNKENTAKWLSDKTSNNFEKTTFNLAESAATFVAAMDKMDNYVGVVSSLNTWFGSKIVTSDGILMNNALAGFEIPSDVTPDQSLATANQMSKGKRPLANYVAALASDANNVCGSRLLVGGSTPDSVGQVLYAPVFIQGDLVSSIGNARILVRNDSVLVEDAFLGFSPQVLSDYKQQFEPDVQLLRLPYTSVHALEKHLDVVLPFQDVRSRGVDELSQEN